MCKHSTLNNVNKVAVKEVVNSCSIAEQYDLALRGECERETVENSPLQCRGKQAIMDGLQN